jgi:hypothetical protein
MNKYYQKNGMNIKAPRETVWQDPFYNMCGEGYGFHIVEENGKHGIVHRTMDNVILPLEYGDIFYIDFWVVDYKDCVLWFKICKGNKAGLFLISFDYWEDGHVSSDIEPKIVAECEYDYIYELGNRGYYVLGNNNGFRYVDLRWNWKKGLSRYYERIVEDDCSRDILHAYDVEKHYIIDLPNNMVAFESDSDSSYGMVKHLGNRNFADYNKHQLLIEGKPPIDFDYIHPIPSDRRNIANIIEVSTGTGVLDSKGEVLIAPEYEKITYELKITAVKDGEDDVKIVPMGSFSIHEEEEEWYFLCDDDDFEEEEDDSDEEDEPA